MTLSPAVAAAGVTGAAAALARGEAVVVTGETGTALVAAAALITDDTVRLLASGGAPIGCALPGETLDRLRIPAMVPGSVVHVGVSAGGSVARTLRALADPASARRDFRIPGPVFPTRTAPLGVLARPALAEAASDLVRLAGGEPAAAFGEIEVVEVGLPVVSTADIVAHRRAHERLVERVAAARLPLTHGGFRALGYRDLVDGGEHVALVHGEPGPGSPVRAHVECLAADAFGARHCACAAAVRTSLTEIAATGSGTLIYLRGRRSLWSALREHTPPDARADPVTNQILRDLGLSGAA